MRDGLNGPQRQAVATLSGPLVVLAAAGTGKTRVIIHRIVNLIRHGTPPDRILALTFTNKAAKEMRERAIAQLGKQSDKKPWIGTFHSLCVRILREDIDQLGETRKFAICDSSDQDSLARRTLRECRVDPQTIGPAELLSKIGSWKSAGLRAADVEPEKSNDDKERVAGQVYASYENAMRAAGILDFDDLLLRTEELLRKFPDVLQKHRGRYDHILVDEYQDTNHLQYKILRQLASEHRNLCVVGDDDQSIYGWRGAEVANFRRLEKDFEGARFVRLEHNYRSCPNILALANELIRRNSGRYTKELKPTRPAVDHPRYWKLGDENEEAQAVVRDIADSRVKLGRAWRDFAVLFRTNEQPRIFETEFRNRGIPYSLVGGFSFFDRREVRDVLAYLRVVANPHDEVSLLRILNVPPRGLGPTVVGRLLSMAAAAGCPLWDVLAGAAKDTNLPSRTRAGVGRVVEVLEKATSSLGHRRLFDIANDLVAEADYRAEITRAYSKPEDQTSRWQSVRDVLQMLASYEDRSTAATLTGFLDGIALAVQEEADDEEERNAVTLMTLHCAKGLEFPHVYLVGMEQGILPHERCLRSDREKQEERRLAYVGITRARDRLTLTRAVKRRRYGKLQQTLPSDFLPEMFGRVKQASSITRPDSESGQSNVGPLPNAAALQGISEMIQEEVPSARVGRLEPA